MVGMASFSTRSITRGQSDWRSAMWEFCGAGQTWGGGEWWGSAGLASCIRADETAGPRLFGTGGSGLVDRILRPFHTADLCNMHRQLTSTVGVTYCWMMKRKRPKKMASSVMRRNSQRLRMRWVRGKLTWGRGSGGRVLM
jgi:hypothetical protein